MAFDMNCSAEKSSRKWSNGAFGRTAKALVTAAALAAMNPILVLATAVESAAAARRSATVPRGELFARRSPSLRGSLHELAIPLPRPRPPEASPAPAGAANGTAGTEKVGEAEGPSQQPSEPSACRTALTEEIAIAPSIPAIHGPGGCGGEDLVRLEAIILPDKHRVAVKPPAILRCPMALAVAGWVRTDVAPLAASLGSETSDLDNFDSFECRGRNRVQGAKLSEHGRANALDVRGFALANGQSIWLTDRTVPRGLREDLLHSACARFTTVLGPDSDWYHEDHIHLDLMERRNGYRICQWDVLDPLPKIAPLLPAPRPEEAPARELAEKARRERPAARNPDPAESDSNTETDAKHTDEKKSGQPQATRDEAAPAGAATQKRRRSRRF